jgi:hypothetical protein
MAARSSDLVSMVQLLFTPDNKGGYVMSMPAWKAEIVELHTFFGAWLDGTLPNTDAAFARLVETTDPAFLLITPSGEAITGAALIDQIRAQHASRLAWRMWIERAELRCQSGDLLVATYEEWHQTADTTTTRICTAILRAAPGTPNGLAWLHVHETWLPNGS